MTYLVHPSPLYIFLFLIFVCVVYYCNHLVNITNSHLIVAYFVHLFLCDQIALNWWLDIVYIKVFNTLPIKLILKKEWNVAIHLAPFLYRDSFHTWNIIILLCWFFQSDFWEILKHPWDMISKEYCCILPLFLMV